jgi:hypothetical protein
MVLDEEQPLPICTCCSRALRLENPQMPLCALANGLLAGRLIPLFSAERMTMGKRMALRTARANVRIVHLSEKTIYHDGHLGAGAAAELQRGLAGNAIFFGQGKGVEEMLTVPLESAAEAVCFIFTGANIDDVRGARALQVPAEEVREEYALLRRVSAVYHCADLAEAGLAALQGRIAERVVHMPGPAPGQAVGPADMQVNDEDSEDEEPAHGEGSAVDAEAAMDFGAYRSCDPAPGDAAQEFDMQAKALAEKLQAAEERAEKLRGTMVDEAHVQFAEERVREEVAECLRGARRLGSADERARIERAALTGVVHVSRGEKPLSMYDPSLYACVLERFLSTSKSYANMYVCNRSDIAATYLLT